MKKRFFALIFSGIVFFSLNAQRDVAFNAVPLVNGNVIFEQFIHTCPELTADQKYTRVQQWGNSTFRGNPLLSGIRFDDRARTMTVSLRTNLELPPDQNGERKTMIMSYRFSVSVTNVGAMVVIRDISYRHPNGTPTSPTTYTAEQMITDQALRNSDVRELRSNLRQATLAYFNELLFAIEALFQ